jgi:hypothetical protein
MDGARARAIDDVTATLRRRNARWWHDGNRRPVVFDDIEIKEEEIAHEYDKGALPLVAMPLLLHAHLLVQGQGFWRQMIRQPAGKAV